MAYTDGERVVLIDPTTGLPYTAGGGAGSTGQTTAANSAPVVLASDDPTVVNSNDATATGTITTQNLVPAGTATAGSAIPISPGTKDTLSVQVTGTYTGALSVQATVDGTNWVTLSGNFITSVTNAGAQVAAVPSAGVGIYQVGIGGFNLVRVTALAAVTGTATVALRVTSGNSYVGLDAPLPAGANALGSVSVSGTATVTSTPVAGGSAYSLVSAATTNAASVKATAGSLYELTVSNVTAATIYVKLFNKASAPTVGTDVPIVTIPIAAGSTATTEYGPIGKRFTAGIALAITAAAAATDAVAVTAGAQVSATYL